MFLSVLVRWKTVWNTCRILEETNGTWREEYESKICLFCQQYFETFLIAISNDVNKMTIGSQWIKAFLLIFVGMLFISCLICTSQVESWPKIKENWGRKSERTRRESRPYQTKGKSCCKEDYTRGAWCRGKWPCRLWRALYFLPLQLVHAGPFLYSSFRHPFFFYIPSSSFSKSFLFSLPRLFFFVHISSSLSTSLIRFPSPRLFFLLHIPSSSFTHLSFFFFASYFFSTPLLPFPHAFFFYPSLLLLFLSIFFLIHISSSFSSRSSTSPHLLFSCIFIN